MLPFAVNVVADIVPVVLILALRPLPKNVSMALFALAVVKYKFELPSAKLSVVLVANQVFLSASLDPTYVNTPVVLLYDKLPSPPLSVTLKAPLICAISATATLLTVILLVVLVTVTALLVAFTVIFGVVSVTTTLAIISPYPVAVTVRVISAPPPPPKLLSSMLIVSPTT